jgi:hypothetical protein
MLNIDEFLTHWFYHGQRKHKGREAWVRELVMDLQSAELDCEILDLRIVEVKIGFSQMHRIALRFGSARCGRRQACMADPALAKSRIIQHYGLEKSGNGVGTPHRSCCRDMMSMQLGDMVWCISQSLHGLVMRHPVPALARRYTADSVAVGRVCVLSARHYKSFFLRKANSVWIQCAPRYVAHWPAGPGKDVTSFGRRTVHVNISPVVVDKCQRHARIDPP